MAAMPMPAPTLRRTAVVCLALAGLAGCTSGSAHHASPSASPTPVPPVSASPTQPPVIDPGTERTDDITGTATITLSGGSAPPVHVATTADSPGQLSVDAAGKVRVEVSMRASDGSVFSLAGPAAVGTVSGDHVSVLLMASGVLVDNQQGNTCTVRYTSVSERGVSGSATCDAQNGPQSYTMRVSFGLR